MQRRAAAVYFVLFLAIAAGSFGYITVVDAQRPEIDVQGQELTTDDTLRIGDRVYIASVSEGSGELAWTNQSAQATASLENNSTATYQNQSWTVVIENRTDVSEFDLRQQLNVSGILASDSAVELVSLTSLVVAAISSTVALRSESSPATTSMLSDWSPAMSLICCELCATDSEVSRSSPMAAWTSSETSSRRSSSDSICWP